MPGSFPQYGASRPICHRSPNAAAFEMEPNFLPRDRLIKTGVPQMSVDTKETIREKVAQSRRLLQQSTDPSTVESLRTYIEELERRLLLEMSEGSPK
jgi:hypothetical protein